MEYLQRLCEPHTCAPNCRLFNTFRSAWCYLTFEGFYQYRNCNASAIFRTVCSGLHDIVEALGATHDSRRLPDTHASLHIVLTLQDIAATYIWRDDGLMSLCKPRSVSVRSYSVSVSAFMKSIYVWKCKNTSWSIRPHLARLLSCWETQPSPYACRFSL